MKNWKNYTLLLLRRTAKEENFTRYLNHYLIVKNDIVKH